MKFCSECGKEIREAAVFCDGCGAKTANTANTSVAVATKEPRQMMSVKEQTDNESREQVMEQLIVCYDAILSIGVAHDELTKAEEELSKVENGLTLFEKALGEITTGLKESSSREEFLADINKMEEAIKAYADLVRYFKGTFIASVVLLFMGQFALAGIAFLVTLVLICSPSIKRKYGGTQPECVSTLEELKKSLLQLDEFTKSIPEIEATIEKDTERKLKVQEKVNKLEQTLQSICELETSRFMMEYLPKDYCNLDAVSSFLTYLENKRADTFKEAINVYEDEKHKSKMQEIQQISMDKLNTQSKMMAKSMEEQAKWQKENALRQERMIVNQSKINEEIRFGNAVSVINLVDRWEEEGRLKKK